MLSLHLVLSRKAILFLFYPQEYKSNFTELSRFPSIQLQKTQPWNAAWEIRCNICYCENRRLTHRDVLEQMNWVVVDVICDEIVICYSQESHFWDGEDVHKLFHLRSLPKITQTFECLVPKPFAGTKKACLWTFLNSKLGSLYHENKATYPNATGTTPKHLYQTLSGRLKRKGKHSSSSRNALNIYKDSKHHSANGC